MPVNQLASIKVDHGCGHPGIRRVKAFDPGKKKYRDVLDPAYLRATGAPAIMLERAEAQMARGLVDSVEYWLQHVCMECYRTGGAYGREEG